MLKMIANKVQNRSQLGIVHPNAEFVKGLIGIGGGDSGLLGADLQKAAFPAAERGQARGPKPQGCAAPGWLENGDPDIRRDRGLAVRTRPIRPAG
jgi:hypothetical protein